LSTAAISLDTAANEIAARVHEFIDMPKESIPGEEIMGTASTPARAPLPPFTRDTAMQKVRLAEDGWNTRNPAKVALAYAIDSRWRNRSEFINGRSEIIAFLSRKWAKELDYMLIKEMWASRETALPYASLTSGTTTRVTGIGRMAMRTGSSMMMGSWFHGWHQSTTFPFWDQSANFAGCSGIVPMTTQG
jgi:hypothetical protein